MYFWKHELHLGYLSLVAISMSLQMANVKSNCQRTKLVTGTDACYYFYKYRSKGVLSMEQIYDRALKALMEDHAAEMLPELLPGAELVTVENTELNRMNLRHT